MSIKRLFFDQTILKDKEVILSDEDIHYLVHVNRLHDQSFLHIFNATDGEWKAQLIQRSKRQYVIIPQEILRPSTEQKPIHFYCPLLKHEALNWLVEKATELGVTDFHFFISDHTVVNKANLERFQKIAKDAVQQSERFDMPNFHQPKSLKDYIHSWSDSYTYLVAYERTDRQRSNIQDFLSKPMDHFMIGPEGGFSKEEVELFYKKPFIECISLGNNILRAETAGIVLLGAFQALTKI